MKKNLHNKGFSTLEMLIAMTILIMVLSTIIFVTFGDQSLSIDSQQDSEALTKAQGLLEKEQALAREDFKLVNPVASFPDPIDPNYKDSVSVSYPNVGDYFTKQITSLVTYTGDHNKQESTSLTSLVTNFENAIGGDTCYSNLSGDWTKPKILNTGHTDFATIVGDAGSSYPITDLDAYQGKLYVAVSGATAVTSTPITTASTATDTTISGGVTWTSPTNAKTSDGNNATSSSTLNNSKVTDYLKIIGFGFNIPAWATITGIKVELQKSEGSAGSGNVVDSQVEIVKNNVIGGTSNTKKLDPNPWSTSDIYPSPDPYTTDLWGETWLPADINSSGFGVAISATGSTGVSSRKAQVDNARITITYTRELYVLNTATPASPTFITSLGSNGVASGINAVVTDGTYAYMATNSSSGQLQIANITTTPPTIISTLKLGTAGTSVGSSIFYSTGYVYLGLTNTSSGPKEFNVIDVHDPTNPTLVGSASIGNTVNGIYVLNNYAYVASPNTNDLLVYDVSVSKLSTAMTSAGSFSGTGGLHGKSIEVVGTTAYLGRTFGTNEFYALNAGTISSISDLGHIDLGVSNGSSVNGLIVRDYLAFLLDTAGQFEVWRVDTPSAMIRYDTTPLSAFPSNTNNTPLDCEGNNIYGAYTDSSSKGYVEVITSS